jgi:hypothetical protein
MPALRKAGRSPPAGGGRSMLRPYGKKIDQTARARTCSEVMPKMGGVGTPRMPR